MDNLKFPLGPVHPSLKEPEFFEFIISKEKIIDVNINVGYNFRGIEQLVEKRSYVQAIPLIERVCGICSHCHTMSFVSAIESASEIEISERAKFLRTILAELERIHSHMLWAGVMCDSIGLESLFMHIWKERENLMELFEKISGNRVHYAFNSIGGVNADISDSLALEIKEKLEKINKFNKTLISAFKTDLLIKKRLVGVGLISHRKAIKNGAVGPVARASGVKFDVRFDFPYAAYNKLDFEKIVLTEGDALARAIVRLFEIEQSIFIINQCLDLMPKGILCEKTPVKFSEHEVTFLMEAPRGENLHFVRMGKTNPKRLRIKPPTYSNIYSLKEMVVDHTIADIPVIINSIDPCFACLDRVLVVDEKTGRKEKMNFDKKTCKTSKGGIRIC